VKSGLAMITAVASKDSPDDQAGLTGEPERRVENVNAVEAFATLRSAARAADRTQRLAGAETAKEAALDAWSALVDGRWSVVDHFESDGRRFLVARCHDAAGLSRPRLTRREQQ